MVSTWTIIILAIGVAFFSFGIPWAEVVSSNGFVGASLTPMNLASAVGDTYGPCGCPPWASLSLSATQGTPYNAEQDVTLEAIVPALVSAMFLAAGAWVFPLAFLLAFLSLLRWKVMIFSGLLFITSGASWIAGLATEASHVNSVLSQWAGQAPGYVPPTISAYLGPYLSVLSGVILSAGYLLARRDVVVEESLDKFATRNKVAWSSHSRRRLHSSACHLMVACCNVTRLFRLVDWP